MYEHCLKRRCCIFLLSLGSNAFTSIISENTPINNTQINLFCNFDNKNVSAFYFLTAFRPKLWQLSQFYSVHA